MAPIIGIMGPGGVNTRPSDLDNAFNLARMVAQEGWILLTGGRNEGVMAAAHKGAADADGIIVGVLPTDNKQGVAPEITVPIVTGVGSARNNINILTCDVVVACGTGLGTVSEIALALKADRPVVLLGTSEETIALFNKLAPQWAKAVDTAEQAMEAIRYKLAAVG